MAKRKVSGDIGPIIDVALIAGLAFAAYKVWNLFGGFGSDGPSNVPTAPAPNDPTKKIPIATQPNSNTDSVAKQNAVTSVDAYLLSRDQTDPFGPALYNANADASTLDYNTLVTIAGQINDMKPGFWGQLTKSGMDGYSLYLLIQQYLPTQTDVSNLAIVFQQLYGTDLLTWLWQTDALGNGFVSNGFSDLEWMLKIINYARALPVQ